MTDLNPLKSANAKRWANVRMTRDFDRGCEAGSLPPGQAISTQVCGKNRRALVSYSWRSMSARRPRRLGTQSGQGDRSNRVSVHVPAGRGPLRDMGGGRHDALVNCAPHASRWKDWSAGGALTLLEQYNGIGYAAKGKPSPYVWSGTDQYVSGKYVRDGIFDPSAVDRQLGCAGLILAMMTSIPPSLSPG